jgi:hypothetical protein
MFFLFSSPNEPAAAAVPAATPQPASRASGRESVQDALQVASRTTGVSFEYLLKTARRESDLDPTLRSKTSTATGLFQFLDGTWLETLKADGARYGFGQYAAAITRTPSGNLDIADPALKREVMALREDPVANAVMGGAFTNRNAADLRTVLGRQPTDGELYIAHFFGSGGARKFLDLVGTSPEARADEVFPEAAGANRPIFYDKSGRSRSAAEVYAVLIKQHGTETTTSAAAAPTPAPLQPVQPAPPAGMSTALAMAPEQAEPLKPFAFYGLFQTEGNGPASANVRSMWLPQTAKAAYGAMSGTAAGTPAAPAAAPTASAATEASPARSTVAASAPLDLGAFASPAGSASSR